MIDVDRVRSESIGKWPSIYHVLGIDVGEGKHRPCPACGGKDRFRFDNKKGIGDYYCGQCGAGDGFALVQKVFGLSFLDAVKRVSERLGIADIEIKKEKPKADPKVALDKVWRSSKKLTPIDPVSRYLGLRGLTLMPENVRFCPNCYESDTGKNFMAMVARVVNKDGKPVSIHRTYLEDFKKANIESPKKVMPATEPLSGCAVRLFAPEAPFRPDVLGLAEGLETSIAATQLFKIATWATISTPIMAGFQPVEKYKKYVIFGDNDASHAGAKAAYDLANKLYNKGFEVEVRIPPTLGEDFNDVLMKKIKNNA